MTTRPSEPTARRRLTGDILRRDRPAADRAEARPGKLPETVRRSAPPADLFAGWGEQLPSDYYLG